MLIDKPAGMTSHDVVAIVRRRFGTKAVGHTGTLDPFATGLLVLVLGQATRLARFVEATRKRYLGRARLGFSTTTDDATGDPVGAGFEGTWPDRSAVLAALAAQEGARAQRPPTYSAKKVGGRRSYALARRGATVVLEPVVVQIESLRVADYDPPMVGFRAEVGPGVYLRAVARDLGLALGTGAHLTQLRREAVGRFEVGGAPTPDQLTGREPLLDPLDLVADLPAVSLEPDAAGRVRHGQAVGEAPAGARAALVGGGRLVAVAEERAGRWQPVVVLGPDA